MNKKPALRPLPVDRDYDKLNSHLTFEPHGLAGQKFEGEDMPFGYISTSSPPVPIFELRNFLVYDHGELTALARRMAAANQLLDAASALIAIIDPDGESTDIWCRDMRAAIAKAVA